MAHTAPTTSRTPRWLRGGHYPPAASGFVSAHSETCRTGTQRKNRKLKSKLKHMKGIRGEIR